MLPIGQTAPGRSRTDPAVAVPPSDLQDPSGDAPSVLGANQLVDVRAAHVERVATGFMASQIMLSAHIGRTAGACTIHLDDRVADQVLRRLEASDDLLQLLGDRVD